jgi:D-serine dehydratase
MPIPETWYRPGTDKPLPIPPGHVCVGMNDQHTHMTVPADSPLQVGDMVSFGVSHPCLTFDKWQVLYVANDAYDVISAVRTFF